MRAQLAPTSKGLSPWRVPRVMSCLSTELPTKWNCCSLLLRYCQSKERCWGQNLFFIMSYSVCSCIGNQEFISTLLLRESKPTFPNRVAEPWLLWSRNTFLHCLELEYCKKPQRFWVLLVAETEKLLSGWSGIQWKRVLGSGLHRPLLCIFLWTKYERFWTRSKVLCCDCLSKQLVPNGSPAPSAY